MRLPIGWMSNWALILGAGATGIVLVFFIPESVKSLSIQIETIVFMSMAGITIVNLLIAGKKCESHRSWDLLLIRNAAQYIYIIAGFQLYLQIWTVLAAGKLMYNWTILLISAMLIAMSISVFSLADMVYKKYH
ncbi:MAG: hypothetical protein ACPGO5_00395 [Patescibacteria group bacterium]